MWSLVKICIIIIGLVILLKKLAAERVQGPKIVGGRDTNITEVPWQLMHFVNGSQACGGVIIGPREVLTAGHCFAIDNSEVSVHQYRAGSDQRTSGGKNYTVEFFIVHPEFNLTDAFITHDLAFARVKEPFEFSESVQAIKLAENEPNGGEKGLISGFGLVKRDDSDPNNPIRVYPDVLQSIVLPIIDRETCKEMYSDYIMEVGNDQVCIGTQEGGVGACTLDSGGPIVVNNELVGLASWTEPCAKPHHPTVYTSVPHYKNWIEQQLLKA